MFPLLGSRTSNPECAWGWIENGRIGIIDSPAENSYPNAAKASFLLRNSAVASPDALKPALARCVCDMLSASHLVGAPRMSCSASFTMSRSASPVLRRTRAPAIARAWHRPGVLHRKADQPTARSKPRSTEPLPPFANSALLSMRESFTRRSIT